ncbi:MAG: polysaccharide ABC transporter ATP-binding protein [Planctomycetota bacterium]
MAPREYAMETEGLGKVYRMYHGPARRILETLTFGRYQGHHEFWALRDIDIKLRPGSALGLCGANGAGKSTLLKILAGTTAPTTGRYRFGGRVASLLELGAGFHLDFTGRANITMNGVIMGLTRREIGRKIDEIVEFAELGPYIDEPVRTYSSGMGMRLGFAVAMAMDPEVLIIDEIFAVGDMYFQKKCIDKIYEFRRRNKTILFCSHSLYDLRQLCDQAIWLHQGRCMALGDPIRVTSEYGSFQRDHIGQVESYVKKQYEWARGGEDQRVPDEYPRVLDARVYRMGTEEEVYEITTGEDIELRIWWSNPQPAERPINIAVGFMGADMTTCGSCLTHFDDFVVAGTQGCTVLELRDVHLLSGQFLLPIWIVDDGGVHRYFEFMVTEHLVVRTNTREVGLFRLDHRWRTETRPLPPHHEPGDGAAASSAPARSAS